MRLLVLGGTVFLGRHVAAAALARGDEVTLFHRGRTGARLFPEAEHLRGDRDGDLVALAGRTWDAVVDTSGYVPRIVRQTAELLSESVGRYCFVSSISVYADFSGPVDETSPVGTLEDETVEEMGAEWENYGPLKALCEQVVHEVYGSRSLVMRPGLIVGPHDPTGRFTYWPHRLARGGEILGPGPPERTVQFVDVRDLAEWLLRLLDRGGEGTFNATGVGVPWGELLDGAATTWVDDAFLLEHGVGQWMELPLWVADAALSGLHRADVSRALAAGLTFRPLGDTGRATLAEAALTETAGLAPERERQLLAAWHAR